ncbi:hypothetical protein ACIPQ1_09040 [Pseudomonas sp. LARHCG127]|uniref:hypothetical protein n=1 Tax=unclassified Pseudomonas TaxID=196821 RepID=UPI0039850492
MKEAHQKADWTVGKKILTQSLYMGDWKANPIVPGLHENYKELPLKRLDDIAARYP